MSESKHTPGPWKYREPIGMGRMYHIFFYDEHNIALGRIDGYVDGVSCGKSGYPNREETIANARLIAAAPELLKVSKAVMAWWEEHEYDTAGSGVEEYNLYDDEPEMVTLARKTIEQAEKGTE